MGRFNSCYRFPFEWSNLLGYLIAFAIEYLESILVHLSTLCFMSFIAGSFMMLISMTKDLKGDVTSINELPNPKENRLELLKKISAFIQYHSDAKQLCDQ